MSATDPWLEARTEGAPSALRERVHAWAELTDPGQPRPERLAAAARSALEAAVHSGQDRSVALDLLAADALVTLALQAQAESDPAALVALARDTRLAAGGVA